MELKDAILLLHPAIAVIIVFPLIGIVVNRALQTRQRRLQTLKEGKSKIPPVVGSEHVQLGRWLTGTVVGILISFTSKSARINLVLFNLLLYLKPLNEWRPIVDKIVGAGLDSRSVLGKNGL